MATRHNKPDHHLWQSKPIRRAGAHPGPLVRPPSHPECPLLAPVEPPPATGPTHPCGVPVTPSRRVKPLSTSLSRRPGCVCGGRDGDPGGPWGEAGGRLCKADSVLTSQTLCVQPRINAQKPQAGAKSRPRPLRTRGAPCRAWGQLWGELPKLSCLSLPGLSFPAYEVPQGGEQVVFPKFFRPSTGLEALTDC